MLVTVIVLLDPEAASEPPGKAVAETSQPLTPLIAWVVLTVPLLVVQLEPKFIVKPVAPALDVVLKTNLKVLSVAAFMRLSFI